MITAAISIMTTIIIIIFIFSILRYVDDNNDCNAKLFQYLQ